MTFGDNAPLFAVAPSQGCNLPNGSAELYRSTDYGKTWELSPVRAPICFNDVFFLDSLYGWAVGPGKDSVVLTIDGGKSLLTRFYGVSGFVAGGVSFIDSLRGWVAGSGVLATVDG